MPPLRILGAYSNMFLDLLLGILFISSSFALPSTVQEGSTTLKLRADEEVTPSPGGTEHVVKVGYLAHKFVPDSTKAAVGDVIRFEFYPVNHSVVRADFDAPCIPREMLNSTKKGFYSGFFPLDSSKMPENPPTWSWKVDTAEPVFFYCSGEGSCNDWGMVGAINPTTEKSVEKHQKMAKQADFSLSPGDHIPSEYEQKETPNSSSSEKKKRSSLSTGATVGLALGAVVILVICGFIIYKCGKWRSEKKAVTHEPQEGSPEQVSGHLLYGRYGTQAPIQGSYYDYSQDPRYSSYYSPPAPNPHMSVYMIPSAGTTPIKTAQRSPVATPAELSAQPANHFSPVELSGEPHSARERNSGLMF
ncbi:hypothetical protein BDZ91DRAFT_196320 [Kalaharituber pfeilii]|nr:hypothetical protein BDZ91DRAFT_196320 [Kalaharituber pfeilii]